MLSLYGPFADIARFLSSPTKLCSITFDSEDIKKVEPFLDCWLSDLNKSKTNKINLDLKIKNTMLYFTEQGQSTSVMKLDFSLRNAYIYNIIVEKGLNNPSEIIFQGSLELADIVKLFEITGRHLRQNLCDEQFNTIYLETINVKNTPSTDTKKFKNSNFYVSWLSNILNMYTPYENITQLEVEVLEREGLLDANLILKQKEFLKDKSLDYYLLKTEEPYWQEFMVASKKKKIARSPFTLLRDELTEQPIGSCKEASVFSELFNEDGCDRIIKF